MEGVRIIVKVSGGMVQAVYSSDDHTSVDVLDYDNMLMADEDSEEYIGYCELEKEIPQLEKVW